MRQVELSTHEKQSELHFKQELVEVRDEVL
jgi:hypothetical protein